MVSEISLTSHDVFRVRILETGPAGTIPLSVAASEVEAIKNLLIFAACPSKRVYLSMRNRLPLVLIMPINVNLPIRFKEVLGLRLILRL